MTAILYNIYGFFAGSWPILQAYGGLGIAIAACLAIAWFSPIYKTQALIAAAGIFVSAVVYSVGVYHGEARVINQTKVKQVHVEKQVEKAVTRSKRVATPDGVRNDPWNSKNN